MFFYNTRVLSVNRKNLQSLNLSWTNLGEPCARPLSCTTSPQPTMYYVSFRWLVLWHHDDCCILDSKNRIHPPECTFFIDIEQLHQFSVPGGWCYDNGDRDGRRSLVATVDTYDVTTDVWSVETQVPKPKFHAGIAIVSDKLYIVGGCLSDILFDRTSGKFLQLLSSSTFASFSSRFKKVMFIEVMPGRSVKLFHVRRLLQIN